MRYDLTLDLQQRGAVPLLCKSSFRGSGVLSSAASSPQQLRLLTLFAQLHLAALCRQSLVLVKTNEDFQNEDETLLWSEIHTSTIDVYCA